MQRRIKLEASLKVDLDSSTVVVKSSSIIVLVVFTIASIISLEEDICSVLWCPAHALGCNREK